MESLYAPLEAIAEGCGAQTKGAPLKQLGLLVRSLQPLLTRLENLFWASPTEKYIWIMLIFDWAAYFSQS